MPGYALWILVSSLALVQGVLLVSYFSRRCTAARPFAWIANTLWRCVRGNRNAFALLLFCPTFLALIAFVLDFILDYYVNGAWKNTHLFTYVLFGLASVVGAVVSILVLLKLGRQYIHIDQVRLIFFDVLKDTSNKGTFIILAAPNPGQYRYRGKGNEHIYVEDFKTTIETGYQHNNGADKKTIKIACLPWVPEESYNSDEEVITRKNAERISVDSLKQSPLGLFLRTFYNGAGGLPAGWNAYCGAVADFLKTLQQLAANSKVQLYWLTDKSFLSNLSEMMILLKSKRYAYLGKYDYHSFGFDILDVHEQGDNIAKLFEILVTNLYGGKRLSWDHS